MPTPPKRKPDSARRANRIIQQRTLLLLALLGIGTFLLLFAQLYKLQIKQHDELKTLAVRQQTLRTTVEASRGTIYDKNGDILALSSTAENVCVSPLDVAKNEQDQDLIANGLGEILGVDPSGILDDMKDTASQYKVIKKKVEQETADKVRVFISDNDIKGYTKIPVQHTCPTICLFRGSSDIGYLFLPERRKISLHLSGRKTVEVRIAHRSVRLSRL